jgi:hypothetical protein
MMELLIENHLYDPIFAMSNLLGVARLGWS